MWALRSGIISFWVVHAMKLLWNPWSGCLTLMCISTLISLVGYSSTYFTSNMSILLSSYKADYEYYVTRRCVLSVDDVSSAFYIWFIFIPGDLKFVRWVDVKTWKKRFNLMMIEPKELFKESDSRHVPWHTRFCERLVLSRSAGSLLSVHKILFSTAWQPCRFLLSAASQSVHRFCLRWKGLSHDLRARPSGIGFCFGWGAAMQRFVPQWQQKSRRGVENWPRLITSNENPCRPVGLVEVAAVDGQQGSAHDTARRWRDSCHLWTGDTTHTSL